jgi:uncharacterized protein (DUF2235 family)
MPKNIVVFSDGTGQEGGVGNNTNVYKLFNMVEDRTDNQVTFYDKGLGTGFRKITGNISGMGISQNIYECYEFIFNNYKAGDQIFLFGFSRGATTVRSLSSFIHYFGILPMCRRELIKKAYKIYKIGNKEKRKKLASEFLLRHHNHWCKIKFLGVWDTVDALGFPIKKIDALFNWLPWFRHTYHNLDLSETVVHARQALAIDDERLIFHPKIWNPKTEVYQDMKQVWFCGMHTDVGGGYEEQRLSDIPLLWMIQEAKNAGLRIYPDNKVSIDPDENGVMHNSRHGFPGKLYKRKVRTWNTDTHGKPFVHESVIMRKKNKNNTDDPVYHPWIVNNEYETEPWSESQKKKEELSLQQEENEN